MSKVIFLDIDGVLNNRTDMQLRLEYNGKSVNISPSIMDIANRLFKICVEDNISIVISSTQRHKYDIENWNGFFETYFDEFKNLVVGITPTIGFSKRDLEINEYIKNNDVTDYFVLDDDTYYDVAYGSPTSNYIDICAWSGLTNIDVTLVRDYFQNKKVKVIMSNIKDIVGITTVLEDAILKLENKGYTLSIVKKKTRR